MHYYPSNQFAGRGVAGTSECIEHWGRETKCQVKAIILLAFGLALNPVHLADNWKKQFETKKAYLLGRSLAQRARPSIYHTALHF